MVFRRISPLSEPPLPFSVGYRVPAGKWLVDEDDVVSDALDALPGDVILLSPAEEAEKAAGPVDHQRHHLPLRHPHIHISHESQTAPVTDIDDLLAP